MLSGGYDDWLSRFPLLTTNPHASSITKAADPVLISNGTKEYSTNPLVAITILPLTVDDIDYPDFDLPYPEVRKGDSGSKISQPTVNRTTKPSVGSNRTDRNLEPPKPIGDAAETLLPNVPFELESQHLPTVVKNTSTPTVDRNLKHNAIMKYLQDEENMMEKSLVLAQEQLDKEKEWERIRMEREVSANSEINAQLLHREEQMIEAFKKLELEKKQQVNLFRYVFETR